jgi:hypothetical protein
MKMREFLTLTKYKLLLKFYAIRRVVWNRGIFLFWCILWVRKNEFHYSLSLDVEALVGSSVGFKAWCFNSLNRRRGIAHKKDLIFMDRFFFFREFIWKNA